MYFVSFQIILLFVFFENILIFSIKIEKIKNIKKIICQAKEMCKI